MSELTYESLTREQLENCTYEEDFQIHYECEECGHFEEGMEEEVEECVECQSSSIIPQTAHEGKTCFGCGEEFDMWEDGYVLSGYILCKSCYDRKKRELP